MKDAYYFSHDSNARNDEKILFIRSKYGGEGYGIYWMFIECMHEDKYGKLNCKFIDGLALNFNIDITLLKQFYNDAITIGLFITDNEFYWSERVLKNKQEFNEKRIKKSEAGKKGMASRWSENITVLKQNYNTVITKYNKVKESKVKQSKVNEIKVKEKEKEYIYTSFYKNLENLKQKAEFVYMSDEQLNKLISKYSEAYVNLAIEKLNIWKLEKHEKKQYKDCYGSDYLKILKWVMMAVIEDQKKLDYGKSQKVIENMQKAKDPELTRKCEEMISGGYMTWEHAQKFSKEQIDACYIDYKKRLEIEEA